MFRTVIADYESAPIPPKGLPTAGGSEEKKEAMGTAIAVADADVDDDGREPTEEEIATLRLVPAKLGWPGLAMWLVGLPLPLSSSPRSR